MTAFISHPSPNFGTRRHGKPPDMVVLHYTGMATCDAALARLSDPKSEVSAHYLISEEGTVYVMVDEALRAWHAGAGTWGGVNDVNSHSVGIEMANRGVEGGLPAYPDAQMTALEAVLTKTVDRWGISLARIIGHSDMAPDRKCDPGPMFDWQRLAAAGLSLWPEVSNDDRALDPLETVFASSLLRFGYPVPGQSAACSSHSTLLAAFRVRFRPGETGPLTADDMAIAAALARTSPNGND